MVESTGKLSKVIGVLYFSLLLLLVLFVAFCSIVTLQYAKETRAFVAGGIFIDQTTDEGTKND